MMSGSASGRKLTPGDTDQKIDDYGILFNQAWEEIEEEEEKDRLIAQQIQMVEEMERAERLAAWRRETRSSTGSLPPPRDLELKESLGLNKTVAGGQGEGAAGGGGDSSQAEMDLPDGPGPALLVVAVVAGPSRPSQEGPTPNAAAGVASMDDAGNENNDQVEVEMISKPSSDIQAIEIEGSAEAMGSAKRRGDRSRGGGDGEKGPLPLIPISVGKVDDGVYHVESIVDVRIAYDAKTPFEAVDGIQYKVKWKGWPESYNSWEPETNIDGDYAKGKFWKNQLAQSAAKNAMKRSEVYEEGQGGAVDSLEFFESVYDF